jgi:hypothetical protein
LARGRGAPPRRARLRAGGRGGRVQVLPVPPGLRRGRPPPRPPGAGGGGGPRALILGEEEEG